MSLLWRSIGRQRFLQKQPQQQYACISTESAKKILGLSLSSSSSSSISLKELRVAYFKASKACHPDTQFRKNTYQDATLQFLTITEAYEQLKQSITTTTTTGTKSEVIISKTEEQEFRDACQEWLGISAEIVEESKQCPIFREWLKGKVNNHELLHLFTFLLNF